MDTSRHEADDLKKRTKQFALRILKLAAALLNTVEGKVIKGSLSAQVPPWAPIIARHVAADRQLNSLRRSVWLKKSRMGVLVRVDYSSSLASSKPRYTST